MPANVETEVSPRPGMAAVGCVIASLGLALVVIPATGGQHAWTIWAYVAGAAAVVLGAVIVGADVRRTIGTAGRLSSSERAKLFGQTLFDRHATGLAYFFMVVVLLVSVVTAMLLYNGQLAVTARDFAAQLATGVVATGGSKGKVLSIVLVLSIALSWCGAGLFMVQRLEAKRHDPEETFNFMEFFRGLWSRIGQANLYTLLFFLLIWGNGEALGSERVPGGTNTGVAWDIVRSYAWLPLLGLVSGLLVKSAESVIFGLGTRILAAVSGFLGSDANGASKSVGKSGSEATGTERASVSVPGIRDAGPVMVELKGGKEEALGKGPSRWEAPAAGSAAEFDAPSSKEVASFQAAAASSKVTHDAAPTPQVYATGTGGHGSSASPTPSAGATPAALGRAGATRRESSMISSFGSSFSVPTSAPPAMTVLPVSIGERPDSNGDGFRGANGRESYERGIAGHAERREFQGSPDGGANGVGHSNGSNGTSSRPRVVPVAMPAPATVDVRPVIVPTTAPASTSVMVNVERPDVPRLRDVVGPAASAKAVSSTTGIPQASMWPALIRVVAPSRMSPNEPKILLPDLPEG